MSEQQGQRLWIHYGNHYELQGDGFHISYNPDTSIQERASWIGDELEETALCRTIGRTATAFILNGDWRRPYEERIDQGYDTCYLKADHQSSWSSDYGTDEP